ncbi:TonB-dependent receptor [Niastella yeongjuensis]|uniref:TonB-dependent receptor n=1 Tax=Niastella yeongjuensis TaxID=354355 RepID=A0A1V9ELY1_9BACT|nr:TonB-dependent receptor [Niastella yeongjuensis]OQP47143.1 TonB-dependent receptor [Niastella yeongjuensis]SEN71576.1 iron complex outermembrane recepter protein [Niastella yeongjuensis]
MKGIYALALLLLATLHGIAQQATVKGIVKNEKGDTLTSASVFIKGKKIGTVTTSTGQYELINLNPGSYTVQVSLIGYEPAIKKVSLTAGENQTIDFTLKATQYELQQVEITGRRETGYKNTTSFIGSKTATPLKDLPQSVSYVTKEVMQDQAAARVGDVVKNFSGVNQFTANNDIAIRGFRVSSSNATMLVNGLRANSSFWKQPPANYLERVEVIKGPVSALFGNASPGGTINRVTKKPLDQTRNSVSFITGSFNTFRALADATGPMNDSKTLLYRMNIAYENAQSFRDLQFEKNIVLAPSISFLPTDKTRLNFDLVYNKSNSRIDRGQSVFTDDLYSTPISLSLNAVNDHLNEEQYSITTSLTHNFTSNTSFNIAFIRTSYSEDLFEHRSSNTYARDIYGKQVPFLIERQVFDRKSRAFNDNISTYFTHKMNTGILEHKIVIGYDYAQDKLPIGAAQLTASGYLKKDGTTAAYSSKDSANFVTYKYKTQINGVDTTLNLMKPNVPTYDLAKNEHNIEDVSKYVYAPASNESTIPHYNYLNGAYVQDQITLGKLQVLLGLRYEWYTDRKNYTKAEESKVNQTALLPRLGVVYAVTPNINAYAMYTQGYNPQPTSAFSPTSGGPFDPLESNMVEAGFKSEWFNKHLSITTSIYRIEQLNALYPAPAPAPVDSMIQIGKETSKGFEFEMVGQLTDNWNVVLNYAYNEAKLTEAGGADKDFVNQQKPNAPKNQGNIWTKYSFKRGGLKGFGIGAGANFVSKRYLSLNQAQTIPGYELLNAALYYKIDKFQIQFNLNNILDKTYWVGGYDYVRLFPGAPRNWLATVAYTF